MQASLTPHLVDGVAFGTFGESNHVGCTAKLDEREAGTTSHMNSERRFTGVAGTMQEDSEARGLTRVVLRRCNDSITHVKDFLDQRVPNNDAVFDVLVEKLFLSSKSLK